MTYEHILIPTDGSELGNKGVAKGIELAKLLHSDVTIVTVTEPMASATVLDGMDWEAGGNVVTYKVAAERQADHILEAARRRVTAAGLSCDVLHIAGKHTAEGIVLAAKQRRTNLIVMASHARRGLARLLMKSETRNVLSQSPVPVLVVS